MAVIRVLVRSALFWVLVAAVAAGFATRAARAALARDARFLALPAYQEARGPAWGGTAAIRPVLERLDALGPLNLFAPDFEARVRGALQGVPGVRRVGAVKRLWPRRYAVDLRLHRPAAVVACDGARIPVTAGGVALPAAPYARATRGLLVIRGVDVPPPRPGRLWRSRRLADGLATVAQLGPRLRRLAPLGLAEVDVAGAEDARSGVVVRGRDGIVVRWGRPRARVGENSVARKADYLELAARHLDRVRGFEIDVRFGTLYLRESNVP